MRKLVKQQALLCIERNKEKVDNSTIKRIHPDFFTYYYSVNALSGIQDTGKSFNTLVEVIGVAQYDPFAHQLIYISRYGDKIDATIESLKELLTIPLVYIRYDEAEEYFKKMLAYKALYEQVMAEHLEDRIDDEQKADMLDVLNLQQCGPPVLHTYVLFDDVSKNPLLRRDESYFNGLMGICRKIHCSFFLTIQAWSGINTTLKANVTTCYIFGCYSRQQFQYIVSQVASKFPWQSLYETYRQLSTHDALVLNPRTGEVEVDTD